MEYANSLGDMLMIATAGVGMMLVGFFLVKDSLFEQ